MNAKRAGVADIFRRAGSAWRQRLRGGLDRGRLKVMAAIEACRTAVLGGHLYQCDGCGCEHPRYNSCRNRHCPTCQGAAARQWMEARAADILPVPYFHIVFTLPPEIAIGRRPESISGNTLISGGPPVDEVGDLIAAAGARGER